MAQSKREKIADNIVHTLLQIDDPKPVFVTREPFTVEELANTQMPAVLVQTLNEERTDVTIGNNRRTALITYALVCYTNGIPRDTAINELVEVIEEKLDADRTRDSNAKTAEVRGIEIDIEASTPYAVATITYEVFYDYIKGDN